MTFLSEPSGFIESTRPAPRSSTNKRPTATLPAAPWRMADLDAVIVSPFSPGGRSALAYRCDLLGARDCTAPAQAVDFLRVESELFEHLFVVFSNFGSASRRHLRDIVHLYRTADRQRQVAAGALERNHHLVLPELRVLDHVTGSPHYAERDVGVVQDVAPVRHGLCTKDCVQNCRELGRIRRLLGRIGESRIRQELRATNSRRERRPSVGGEDDQEPGVIGGSIHVERCVRWIRPVVQREERRRGQRGLNRDTAGPDPGGEKRRGDIGALAGALSPIQAHGDRGEQRDRRGMIAAARDRQRRRRARIARQGEQSAAGPVGRDVESRKLGIGPLVAVTGEVAVDETRIPLHHVLIGQLQSLACWMGGVDDQHVCPLDQSLENLPRLGRFQVECQSPLVAIVQMPGIVLGGAGLGRNLVPNSPGVARGRLDLDDVGAEVGQDHRRPGTGDEARQVHYLQSGKNVVGRHECLDDLVAWLHRPWNCGSRLARKADVPSCLSSVAAQSPKNEASSTKPSAWLVSSPRFTASSEYVTAIGALAKICFRMASARGISSAAGTTSFTSPMRYASWALMISPDRMSCSARPLPTSRGRRCVPPPPGGMPRVTSGWPNLAFSEASLMVHAMAVSHPPPSAKPLTAAITGLPRFSIRSSTACPKRLDCCAATGVIRASSLMSAPAMNALSPLPVRMTPRTAASSRASSNAVRKSSQVLWFRAFSTFGRLSVT